jgi:predicted permease
VSGQVALAMVALASAGLFVRSLWRAQQINPGYDAGHLVVVSFDLGTRGYTPSTGRAFFRQVQERVRHVPGVDATGLATDQPFHNFSARTLVLDTERSSAEGQGVLTLVNRVEPGYFQTLRIPLLGGRDFSDFDMPDAPPVAVINAAMAHRFWPGPVRDAVGKQFRFFGENTVYQIVGVVKDSCYLELGETPRAMVYLSLRQIYSPSVTLYAHSAGDPARVLGSVRGQVQQLDQGLLLTNIRTVPQILDRALWAPRIGAALLSIFGALALLLAAVGLYGVISYSVSQRIQEIGVRMALGACPADVVLQILREGIGLVGSGIVVGLCGALAAARVLTGLLFGITVTDVPPYAVVTAMLVAVSLGACYLPARRATRVNPTLALRAE